jgi:hypothetical protein
VFVYDKSNDKQFHTNIKNIAAERGFYNFETPAVDISMESLLTNLEGMASKILNKIRKEKKLSSLTSEEASILVLFVSVQFVRTKEYRTRFTDLAEELTAALKERGASNEQIEALSDDELDEHTYIGLKAFHDVRNIVPYFADKAWIIFETSHDVPFYISDNPVVLHNDNDLKPYGNLGLSVKGIQIYFPVSPTLCLAMYCPSIADEIMLAAEKIKELDLLSPGMADQIYPDADSTRKFANGLADGSAIQINSDNVKMMNSLQVIFSTRYVYDQIGNFSIVEEMIKDNQQYRSALRPKCN